MPAKHFSGEAAAGCGAGISSTACYAPAFPDVRLAQEKRKAKTICKCAFGAL